MIEEERSRREHERSQERSVEQSVENSLVVEAAQANSPNESERRAQDEAKADGDSSLNGKTMSQSGSNRPPTP